MGPCSLNAGCVRLSATSSAARTCLLQIDVTTPVTLQRGGGGGDLNPLNGSQGRPCHPQELLCRPFGSQTR